MTIETQPPAKDSGVDRNADASGGAATGANPPTRIPMSPSLESLASHYIPEQHATYLRHLKEAVGHPQNLNIALTGRYGTGKSSVLDEFEFETTSKTLRIAISTLGPSSDDVTLTNRIQKELVKQLLYRAAPRDLRFSRFNRIIPLSNERAAIQATLTVAVVGSILSLLRWLPVVAGTGPSHRWPVRLSSWLALAALAVVALTVLQRVVYGRFVVSNVSAAGAAVALTQSNSTFFDEYLEEIVYFFDEVSPDIVIFEDLDRFDDPHIFEALRELNTLLNQTAKRLKKGEPLRFIYAIKDSLFERLGSEAMKSDGDAAAAETERANRTKFFDVVIPLVPFISHRNARELLAGLLATRGFRVDRPLMALVAQHTTDMRLLRNICNEYTVFAERLIDSDKTAPGLNESNLFALVAYKNFHLEDFEEISRRNSDLDLLYDKRRELVRAAIDDSEARKRAVLNEPARFRSMQKVANQLGERLIMISGTARANSNYANWPHLQFQLPPHPEQRSQDQVESYQFWAAVAGASEIVILTSLQPNSTLQQVARFNRSQIQVLFPEASDATQWAEFDESKNRAALAQLDDDIAFLRGADFDDLADESRFILSAENGQTTFADVIDATMKSQLARDLVKQGYLDRNFALYAAQFYGEFTGVDVANFIVHCAETNQMDIDYTFSEPAAIANLLSEAQVDFTHTISAYNTEILDYLLEQDDPRAIDIARTITSRFGDDAQEFLKSYCNSGKARARFAALLGGLPWPRVFTYFAQDPSIPAVVRPILFDAALRESKEHAEYKLGPELRDFIVANYSDMEVFTSRQNEIVAAKTIALVKVLGVVFPELAGLDHEFRDRVVHEDLYLLTADNLRAALGTTENISFDIVRENEDVYARCMLYPDTYLTATQSDADTPYAVLTGATLAEVLTDAVTSWEADDVRKFVSMAAPEIRLDDLDRVPTAYWPELAWHHLFRSTVRNVRAYRDAIGSIDLALGDLLVRAGSIDDDGEGEEARMSVATAVLNAADSIPDAEQRVSLVMSLRIDEHYLAPEQIEPEAGNLFTLLLANDLIEDSHESFARFRSAGWHTIEPAIARSKNFVQFMTPELIGDLSPKFLASDVVPRPARDKFINNLTHFVPGEDAPALTAAGHYCLRYGRKLPTDQVRRIAFTTRDIDLTLRLLAAASPMPPAPDLVGVLAGLGAPYSNLTTRAEQVFEVPATKQHRKILEYLKQADLVAEFKKKRLKDVYTVTLA